MLSAAVVSANQKTSERLRACLQQTGLVKFVLEWDLAPERCPGSAEGVPDVVLLDLGREAESCFALAAQLRRLRPSVCIIACSSLQEPSPDLLMQAMRSGVQEFLPQPVEPQLLQNTLTRFIEHLGVTGTDSVEKLIVLMGAKGGVGATTVTVNLGVQLAQLAQKRVVLLDFARPLGHVALLLDLQPRFSIHNALENLERLDSHFLSGLLTQHKSGVEVLAGTANADQWLDVSVPGLNRVVNVAQGVADFVLMDLGSMYSTEWASVLHQARTVILVTEVDVPGLWNLERQVSLLSSSGLDPERLHILINRWHRRDDEALKSLEKKLERPLFARLPNDFRQVREAVDLGVPLSRNHNDPLTTKFRQLASQLAGIMPAARPSKPSGFLNLFPARSTR
jgi:pilus assembly protein CpaE